MEFPDDGGRDLLRNVDIYMQFTRHNISGSGNIHY